MKELMVCVAPYPGEKQEEKHPGPMDVAQEVIDCSRAGAALAHLHVRDDEGLQTTDVSCFRRDLEKIRSSCPIIVEGSTGGAPEHTLAERCVSFTVQGVEMGSLNLGSVNMWDGVYNNRWADIQYYGGQLKERGLKPFLDCFDLSHFSAVPKLEAQGLIGPPFVFGLIFDVPNALTYRDKYLDVLLGELPPESCWFMVRHHARGARGFEGALERGGHIRVGYEDGPFLSDGSRAGRNVRLVEDIVEAAEKRGRRVVTAERAREIMGIARP